MPAQRPKNREEWTGRDLRFHTNHKKKISLARFVPNADQLYVKASGRGEAQERISTTSVTRNSCIRLNSSGQLFLGTF